MLINETKQLHIDKKLFGCVLPILCKHFVEEKKAIKEIQVTNVFFISFFNVLSKG